MNVGALVRVLPPFSDSFPGEHLITEVVHSGDGTITYILGDLGGFDQKYLEVV